MNTTYRYSFSTSEEMHEVFDRCRERIQEYGYLTVFDLYDILGRPCDVYHSMYIGWPTLDHIETLDNHYNRDYKLTFPDPVSLPLDSIYKPTVSSEQNAKLDNVERHEAICKELTDLYARKIHDYGDAFHDTYLEEGFAMARIRLTDKLKRFKQLSLLRDPSHQQIKDESIRNTLIDLANYAIMTVMEIDREEV